MYQPSGAGRHFLRAVQPLVKFAKANGPPSWSKAQKRLFSPKTWRVAVFIPGLQLYEPLIAPVSPETYGSEIVKAEMGLSLSLSLSLFFWVPLTFLSGFKGQTQASKPFFGADP